MRRYILILILFINSLSTFARHCGGESLSTLNLDEIQGVISVIDGKTSTRESAKKISIHENVNVEGLTKEIFYELSQSPQNLAKIFGGKLISSNGANDFKMEIPGILGFDLSARAQTRIIAPNVIKVELSDFNTFFYEGSGQVELILGENGEAMLKLQGEAFVPKTPAGIFIFGVGGVKNFENLIQDEVEKQIQESLKRFQSYLSNR